MHKMRVLSLALLLASAGALISCTNDSLDDGTGPDVVLEVTLLENQPVTASEDEQTGGCTLEVQDWSAGLKNAPKNVYASGTPFNDIVVIDVTIEYNWIDPAIQTRFVSEGRTPRVVGLGDITIPANSVQTVRVQL